MFNTQSIVLKMLLMADKITAINIFSRLHKDLFNDAFASIYKSIHNYYKKHGDMPSIDSLVLESSRNAKLSQALSVLINTPTPEVDILHAIQVLESEYTQDLFLQLVDSDILRDITMLDKDEIIDRVSGLALKLEEKVSYTGNIFNANQISIFEEKDSTNLTLIPLGLCNEFDAYSGGLGRGETLLIGGYRGTGKSVVCSNLQVNQYEQGNIAPYFSLEMKAVEVLRRNLAIMSGISALDIRKQQVKDLAVMQLARTRAKMFLGGEEYYQQYIKQYSVKEMSDFYEFEQKLMGDFELHTPMIIIHDPELTTAKLDGIAYKTVSQYGEDKVPLIILDYINQVKVDGSSETDMYDWKQQMIVSKSFKNTCAKLNVGGVTPYQMDKNGNARMSQGILDSCDMAMNLNAAKNDKNQGGILFDFVKVRSMSGIKFMPATDWNCLKIDNTTNLTTIDINEMQAEFVLPIEENKSKQRQKPAAKAQSDGEGAADI